MVPYLVASRRIRQLRRALLVFCFAAWVCGAVGYNFFGPASSGEHWLRPIDLNGNQYTVVIKWVGRGWKPYFATTEVSIELRDLFRGFSTSTPSDYVALQRTGEFQYTFKSADGTTLGPIPITNAELGWLSETIDGFDIRNHAIGVEWSWQGMALSTLLRLSALTPALIVAIVFVLIITHEERWTRRNPNECPACGYNTAGSTTGCPECGWGRESRVNPSS